MTRLLVTVTRCTVKEESRVATTKNGIVVCVLNMTDQIHEAANVPQRQVRLSPSCAC
jgi:hypothetical protein